MAVTIQTSPDTINTASNPLVWTFSSTQTGQDNFSFVVELTVGGSVHSYHQVFPESSNYGKFDASEIVRSIIFSDLITDGSLVTVYSNAITDVSIRVIDKYGTPPTQQGSWASSSTMYAFNGSLRHQDWIGFDYTDYDVATASDTLMLTDFPRAETYYVGINESQFVATLNSDNSQLFLSISLYDVNDSLIGSTIITGALTAGRLVVGDVSPQTIISNTAFTSANFDDCYYYRVRFRNTTSGTKNNENFTFYIDRECTMYTTRRLHWLNKYGVWDSFTFRLYSEEQTTITDKRYEINKGTWSDTNTWDYNLYNGQLSTASRYSKDRMILNSDWIKEDKHNWLVKSLLESPKVYLEVSQGTFELVNLNTNSFIKKQKIKEGLINETISVDRTYTYTSQLS